MTGATALVPLLTTLSTAVAPATSGLNTLLYMAFTGFRIRAYLGSSFGFMVPIIVSAESARSTSAAS